MQAGSMAALVRLADAMASSPTNPDPALAVAHVLD